MNEETTNSVHWSFWVIGTVALIWNVLGSINFFVQMSPGALEAYRDSERAIVEGRPIWATSGFALSVFGGAIGCLLLLLRKRIATYVFAASLVGTIITMVHTLNIDVVFGVGEIVGIVAMPLVVAALLIWYAKYSQDKGWTR